MEEDEHISSYPKMAEIIERNNQYRFDSPHVKLDLIPSIINFVSGPVKWISKWRGHGTLKSIVGHHGWPTRKIFEF